MKLTSLLATLRNGDPRWYQITMLTLLVGYGTLWLDFEIAPLNALVILISAIGTQYVLSQAFRLPRFDPKSALISSLSLCLLLRTNAFELAAIAAVVTIASKFVLRLRGRHFFNPTNFGLVVMMLATGQVWVSPGQWGSAALLAFLLAGLGMLVVRRAERSDVTYAFMFFYGAIIFGRALWLGDPLAIPLHQLQNGALLIFAFFMISDPKTTPDSRAGRILFALLTALGADFVHFGLFKTNGFIWALAVTALTVPLINIILPGTRYKWQTKQKGEQHAAKKSIAHAVRALVRGIGVRFADFNPGHLRLLRLLRGQGRRNAL